MARLSSYAIWSNTVLTLACAGMANAQTTGEGESGELQEIIVTATRVTESLQKTALAIQAFSSEDIVKQGAVTPEDVGKLVPSMNISAGTSNVVYLRGLGANSAGGFGQNSISFSVDGVILSQPAAVNGNFFDLERLEVLKGPQGTLYGRNASAGAMNVITKNPSQELGGALTVEAGNYHMSRLSGALNVPLSDTFAIRGALYSNERDGYNSDGTDDDDQLNGRFKALWTPNDSLSVLLGYSQSDVTTKGGITGTTTIRPPLNGDVRLGPTNPLVSEYLVSKAAPEPNPQMYSSVENQLVYATVDWDLGFGTLTYIPAYGWGETCGGCKASLVPYPARDEIGTHIENEQLSNELRLAHVGDRFKYVVGAYQFAERIEMDNLYYFSASNGSGEQHIDKLDTDSYAAFGELTFSLTDTFRLIGGLRYTRDEKELAGTSVQAGLIQRPEFHGGDPAFIVGPDPVGIGDGLTPGNPTYTGLHPMVLDNSGEFSRTNWKAGVEYDLSPTSFLFATAATGFKSGIFYPGPGPGNLAEPEYMTAYTIGSKNRFLDNSLQVNAEVFYWDFENQQVSGIGYQSDGSLNFITYNAGASTIYGASMDVQWRITPSDLLRANVEYNHAYYDEFFLTSPYQPPFLTGFDQDGVGGGCPVVSIANGVATADCSDKHMIFAPDWSGNVSYGHDFTVGDGNTLHVEVSGRFNTEQYLQMNWATELSKMPAYVVWDALIEYSFADKPLSVALWGHNLGDKVVYTSSDGSAISDLVTGEGVYQSNLQAPRTYGLRFSVTF